MPKTTRPPRSTLALALLIASLAGCASRPVAEETVEAWRQREDERGRLATGRVVSVERLSYRLNMPSSGSATMVPAVGIAMAPAVAALGDAIRDTGFFYRHVLRMADGQARQVDLQFSYRVDECLALRPGLTEENTWPVRALPGEC